mmetsp:Transcript_28085/g.82626  ORF Transcript_28085/g.82626 Transcript_28085/m.82626 type:complete len:591 (-) Transcript_28085:835-2607(-)
MEFNQMYGKEIKSCPRESTSVDIGTAPHSLFGRVKFMLSLVRPSRRRLPVSFPGGHIVLRTVFQPRHYPRPARLRRPQVHLSAAQHLVGQREHDPRNQIANLRSQHVPPQGTFVPPVEEGQSRAHVLGGGPHGRLEFLGPGSSVIEAQPSSTHADVLDHVTLGDGLEGEGELVAEDLNLDPIGKVRHDRRYECNDVTQKGSLPRQGEQLEQRGRDLAVRYERLDDGVALDERLLAEVVTVRSGRALLLLPSLRIFPDRLLDGLLGVVPRHAGRREQDAALPHGREVWGALHEEPNVRVVHHVEAVQTRDAPRQHGHDGTAHALVGCRLDGLADLLAQARPLPQSLAEKPAPPTASSTPAISVAVLLPVAILLPLLPPVDSGSNVPLRVLVQLPHVGRGCEQVVPDLLVLVVVGALTAHLPQLGVIQLCEPSPREELVEVLFDEAVGREVECSRRRRPALCRRPAHATGRGGVRRGLRLRRALRRVIKQRVRPTLQFVLLALEALQLFLRPRHELVDLAHPLDPPSEEEEFLPLPEHPPPSLLLLLAAEVLGPFGRGGGVLLAQGRRRRDCSGGRSAVGLRHGDRRPRKGR